MLKKYDFKYFFVLLILLTGIIFRVLSFFIQEKTPAEKVFGDSIQSVVEIKAQTDDVGESFGTAVFVKNNGTLVTNAHVVTYKDAGETIVWL